MAPVIDGVTGTIMGSVDDAPMFAYDLSFGDDEEVVGVNPQADRPIGEGRRHAVAIAFQVNEAGRRDALAMFDKAVDRSAHRHQAFHLVRSEEHTSELQSLIRISYAASCLKKKTTPKEDNTTHLSQRRPSPLHE